ncbi:MAG TPA: glutamate--tRNA ligase [Thermoplasmata archaeon]|nr:glutamate--tRNA ligase [Thermoplasmata archaeon]
MADELDLRIRRLALSNAAEHGGEARAGPVLARLLATDPALRARSAELGPRVAQIVAAVVALPAEARARELAQLGGAPPSERANEGDRPELPPLPGAVDGAVALRLAPFPNGALHIGSARMLFINDAYRRRYRGKLFLVFDDTIGSEEKRADPAMYDLIQKELEIVGVPPDAVYYKSDRIPRFYPWARRVIDAGGAYVCRCPAEKLRELREKGLACPERGQTIAETLAEWEGMLGGSYAPGEAVLRLRTDMADPDPAFRDRVLMRISDLDHPRVGRRYRVWPMLEFSWAVDDVELGLTHVLRGKDLVIEDRMEQFIWNLLGIHGPPFLHWGLLRLREAKISKSKSVREVQSGEYDGWADPRTWSIDSLVRRGIEPEALRRFTLSFGMSLADIEVPAETLYAENRGLIDATTPRRAFVPEPRLLRVQGAPGIGRVELANHPDRPELGRRSVAADGPYWLPRAELERHAGGEIRLKDLLNVRLPDSLASGDAVVEGEFVDRENRKLPRIQWVAASEAVPVDLLGIDGSHTVGQAEGALREAAPASRFQFERVGFVRLEAVPPPAGAPVRACFGHP